MQNTILISTGIVASLPIIPVGLYLRFGWPARKQQIVSRFSNESIVHYKETFCPKADFTDHEGFAKDYDPRYGRPLFLFPVLLFSVTLFFLTYLSVSWVFSHDWMSASEGTAKIATFSLAGAYIWITYDLIMRARQNDIVTSDVNRATLRLLVSLPFGFAVSAFAGVVTGSAVTLSTGVLAFFVGAFPTDTVLKFMRRSAAVPLKLDADTSADGVQQLTKIDGISVPIAERLIDEGVKTNLQLAYADPVALTIRSGMDFSFILMCCGQALVRVYFNDDQMKFVRKYGLRTGFEIKALNDALPGYDEATDDAAKAATTAAAPNSAQAAAMRQLVNFANELPLDADSTRFILDQIAGDPYTKFVWWMWPDTSEPEHVNVETPPVAVTAVVAAPESG
jgi:predicted flap endonuclease-1-like 5' DNA nuclease